MKNILLSLLQKLKSGDSIIMVNIKINLVSRKLQSRLYALIPFFTPLLVASEFPKLINLGSGGYLLSSFSFFHDFPITENLTI